MIIGLGTDLCEIDRICQLIKRHGKRFLHRMYTPAEVAYCQQRRRPEQSFAARFAAKEAAAKALGTGIAKGTSWLDIEIVMEESGKPGLRLTGKAAERAVTMCVHAMHLSLSHSDNVAVATVVFESMSQSVTD